MYVRTLATHTQLASSNFQRYLISDANLQLSISVQNDCNLWILAYMYVYLFIQPCQGWIQVFIKGGGGVADPGIVQNMHVGKLKVAVMLVAPARGATCTPHQIFTKWTI